MATLGLSTNLSQIHPVIYRKNSRPSIGISITIARATCSGNVPAVPGMVPAPEHVPRIVEKERFSFGACHGGKLRKFEGLHKENRNGKRVSPEQAAGQGSAGGGQVGGSGLLAGKR